MTPRLTLLNGVPASGKTTLARDWCERHSSQLPLCLDIDSIRSMIGGWRSSLTDAGLLARAIAVAGIAAHLDSDRDVLIPQYLRAGDFIEQLQAVARRHGAVFVEAALMIDAGTAARRFEERTKRAGATEAWGELQADMESITQEFDVFLDTRPRVTRIESGPAALEALEAAIRAGSQVGSQPGFSTVRVNRSGDGSR